MSRTDTIPEAVVRQVYEGARLQVEAPAWEWLPPKQRLLYRAYFAEVLALGAPAPPAPVSPAPVSQGDFVGWDLLDPAASPAPAPSEVLV